MNKLSALAFDLDGTIYYGDRAIEGARQTLEQLASRGTRIFYFTNNSAKTREQICDKLNRLGFTAEPRQTYSASYAILRYVNDHQIRNACVVGTDALKNDLEKHGVAVNRSADAPCVIVGFSPAFHYGDIAMAQEMIEKGARFIIANADASYPVGRDKRLPACGAMVGAIVGATSHAPDVVIGKPNTYMLELLTNDHGISRDELCVVGDSPDSDIKMAEYFKCHSILFDPENAFAAFKGNRIRNHREIIAIVDNGRGDAHERS
ncbi:MAG: HAD-IIA family hydrolase [Candidatus Velamenicoccus archaeovorus]